MAELAYPFVPKSTRWFSRGQFWAILLEGGCYGAGCVVGSHFSSGKTSTRLFIAGVVHWSGSRLPTSQDLRDRPVIKYAFAHLKVVTESGGQILGQAALDLAGAPVAAEALSLPTWGFGVPAIIAQAIGKSDG